MALHSGDRTKDQQAPPLPPSPLAPDAGPPREARLPWCTIAATAAAGAASASLFMLTAAPAYAARHLSHVLQPAGVAGLAGAVLGCALVLADRGVWPRLRPLSWAVALAVPWVAAMPIWYYLSPTWDCSVLASAPLVTGLALGGAARARRFVPSLSLALASGAGALVGVAFVVVPGLLFQGGVGALTAGGVAPAAAVGALASGPFGLAVGLCLQFERKRLEQEGR